MIEALQKYKTVLIVLALILLVAIATLLIILANKKTEQIPLRGVFVRAEGSMEIREVSKEKLWIEK